MAYIKGGEHEHLWKYDNESKTYRCTICQKVVPDVETSYDGEHFFTYRGPQAWYKCEKCLLVHGMTDFKCLERPTDLASPNPKDAVGERKVSLSKLPAIALLHCAHALQNGADKYGAYNWRDHSVLACIYVDAAFRHLLAWLEGEETAKDSGVHHLGHAMACCAILLDAQARGNLLDDRPKGDPTIVPRVLDAIAEVVQEQREKRK